MRACLLVLFSVICITVTAQPRVAPDPAVLYRQLTDAKGSERAVLLIQLARIEFGREMEKAFAKAQEALAIYRAENNEKGQVDALQLVAAVHRRKGDPGLSEELDSLSYVLARKTNYTEAIPISLQPLIISQVRELNYARAFELANEAISIKTQFPPDRVLAGLYHTRGNICLQLQKPAEAAADYQKAYDIGQSINDRNLMARALNGLAAADRAKGDLPNSLDNIINAMKMAEKGNDRSHLASLYLSAGNTYSNLNKWQESLEYYRKAWLLEKYIQTTQVKTSVLGNISRIFSRLNEYDSALHYHAIRADIARNTKDSFLLASVDMDMGNIVSGQGNYRKAIGYFEDALEIYRTRRYPPELALAYNALASAYLKIKEYDKAESYLLKSYDLKDHVDRGRKKYTDYLLSRVYEETGEMDKAKRYRNEYLSMGDSLITAETELKINRLQSAYEISKREDALTIAASEKQLKNLELKQTKIQLWGSVIAIVLLAVIAGVVYKGYRDKKRMAAMLQQKNDRIETLLKELHHRVKNNLQVIGSMLNLQSAKLPDGQARSAIEEGKARVEAISLLHQLMYFDDKLSGIDMEKYLTALINMLTNSFGYQGSVVQTNIRMSPQPLDVDIAMPLALILNEIITNAFKHAFLEVEQPSLTIDLVDDPDKKELMLKVGDNGKGIDLKEVSANSFGLKLIHTFVRQLGARMDIHNEKGTVFNISFTYA